MALYGIGGIGTTMQTSVSGLVEQYMSLERVPLEKMQNERSELNRLVASCTDLNTQLRQLKEAIDDFRWPGSLTPINQFTASSADESSLLVTAGGSASEGLHTVSVLELARAHSIASAAFAGDETAGLSGTHRFAIEQDGEKYELSVCIEEGATWEEVLAEVADAIEASGASISASVATTDATSGEKRLLLTSKQTGTRYLISAIEDIEGDLASVLGIAGKSSGKAYSANTVQEAADARFAVDGLEFVSSGNEVRDAISGVTLRLLAVTDGDVTVTVERDVEAIRKAIDEFISAYNALIDKIAYMTRPADATGEGRGDFTGNVAFSGLKRELRNVTTSPVGSVAQEGALNQLAEIGITADRQGHLSVSDADALEEALRTKASQVESLFADESDGIAVRMVDLIDRYAGVGGIVSQESDLLRTRIRNLDQRISRMEVYLARRQEQLTDRLGSLQAMMAGLASQQQYLSSILSDLYG